MEMFPFEWDKMKETSQFGSDAALKRETTVTKGNRSATRTVRSGAGYHIWFPLCS